MISIRPINPRESVIKRVTATQGQMVTLYDRGATPTQLQVRGGGWQERR